MSKLFHPSHSFILFCLTCLQIFGLYFFLKGFLLTRQTLDIQATQHDVWDQFPLYDTNSNSYNNDNNNDSNIYDKLHPPTIPAKKPFDRVIMIIIDALRFDFLTDMDMNNNQQQQYYLNQFPIIEKLHRLNPSSSLLYQFRADPPTTTMQRVKGLMTGSLPTFIDAGANFASSAVNEDHLLRHIRQRYDNIYFMGDDTWVNLFPEVFNDRNKTFESDSFKMFDLHTVDNRILSHLWPLISSQEEKKGQDQDDWQVIIAHFLGVDHCGHTYGPSHPNMANKLSQMNDVIERLTSVVDQDTLLVVMGDHGMSVEGDHGGESVEELMSGLFLYSGRQLTMKNDNDDYNYHDLFNRIHQRRTEKLGYPIQEIVDRLSYNATHYPIASQIHLVPTLAYLLDVPIPFGNLGALLPDVLMSSDYDNDQKQPQNKRNDQILLHMAQEFRRNALQVYNYLGTYWNHTQHPGFAPSSLDPIYQHFWNAERMFSNNYQQQHHDSDNDNDTIQLMEQIIFEYDTFLISTIKYCDAIWAQFDVGSMVMGIIILILTTCATVSVAIDSNHSSISLRHFLTVWIITMIITLGGIVLFKNAQYYDWFEKMGWSDVIIAANCMALAILFLTIPFSSSSSSKRKLETERTIVSVKKRIPLDWIFLVFGTLINAFTLASNSFVIWEDRGTRYIAATLCILWFFQSVVTHRTTLNLQNVLGLMIPPLIVLVWIRLTGLTGQCREEQFPYCSYIHNGYIKFGGEGSHFINMGYILFNAFLCFYFLPRVFYRMLIMNNNKKDWKAIIFTVAYSISLFIVFIRQITTIYQSSPHEDALGLNIQQFNFDDDIYNPPTTIFSMQLIFSNPLSINIKLSHDLYTTCIKILDVYAPRMVYAITLFSTFFSNICIFNKKNGNSASYLTLLLFMWSVTLAILQQPLGSTILLTSPLIMSLLIRTRTPTKDIIKTTTNRQEGSHLTHYIQIALIYIIGHHLFFVTSHQATFTSLPWKAAFIGFDDMNYYGGATLVALSTLSGYIMTWLGFLSIRYYSSQQSGSSIRSKQLLQDHRLFIYLIVILQAIPTCLSAIFVLILRRHLMTWKIFAPRFMLQALIGVGTSLAVTLCEWLI
ncbi:hypothetical protein INT45_013833 [Circinella minor]|uniref:GPI ethanolamine phosphate transferase 3 n=1 Tax=Circinella minor TaxID=1195481 RepID=A0A8H7RT36_9FUNG|nr:hypothetical protein INT45_013833 [Circinella minor]